MDQELEDVVRSALDDALTNATMAQVLEGGIRELIAMKLCEQAHQDEKESGQQYMHPMQHAKDPSVLIIGCADNSGIIVRFECSTLQEINDRDSF